MIKLKLNNKIELILLISMLEAVYNELYVDSSFKMKLGPQMLFCW